MDLRKTKRIFYISFLTILYMLAASSTEHAFLQKWRTINNEIYSFQKFLDFDVPNPYAYRLLVPSTINHLHSSETIRKVFSSDIFLSRGATLYSRDAETRSWPKDLQTKYVILTFLMFGSLLLAMFSLRGITNHFFKSKIIADFSPILFALFLPLTFRGDSGFMYDFTELGLYFLGLHFLLKGHNFAFLLLIPFLVLNKESAILILIFSAVINLSISSKNNKYIHLAAQGVVAFASYIAIKLMYSSHQGGTTEFHFWGNIDFWLQPSSYLTFISTSTFIIPFPNPSNILFLTLIIAVCTYKWREKPILLKRLFYASSIISLPLFILFCYRDEFRNLSLIYPYIHLLLIHSMVTLYGELDKNNEVNHIESLKT